MTGILSLITFSPLIGVAAILLLRAFKPHDDEQHRDAVDAHVVLGSGEPVVAFDELEARLAAVKDDAQPD